MISPKQAFPLWKISRNHDVVKNEKNEENIQNKLISWAVACSLDTAGRVPHQSPTQPDAGCSVRRGCRVSLIHANSASICANSARIGPNQVVLAGNRNKPKSALNYAGTAEIGFEWGPNILNLFFLNFIWIFVASFVFSFLFCVSCLLLSLFCESRHSNVFFKNILIVKIYRKYK